MGEGASPSIQEAEKILELGAQQNPGAWVKHSRYVAEAAQRIAAAHPNLEPERAYVLGMLHDIGKRTGESGMRHVLTGFRYLKSLGFEGAARICLTHSYPFSGKPVGVSPWDGTPEEYCFIEDYLARIVYDRYDRLIQLCDSLCLPEGFCLLEKRLVGRAMRHGFSEFTLERWTAFFEIKRAFEAEMGISIYRILPGIAGTTFEWKT
jgi:hypothetical protein